MHMLRVTWELRSKKLISGTPCKKRNGEKQRWGIAWKLIWVVLLPGARMCYALHMYTSQLISQECYEVIFPCFSLKFQQKKYENSYQYQKPRLTAGICEDFLLISKCIGVELRNITGSQSMHFFFPEEGKKQIRNEAMLKGERERVILSSFSGFSWDWQTRHCISGVTDLFFIL